MRIVEVELFRFKPFSFGSIERLKITNINDVLIVAGTNGIGKSSFLRECTPLPAIRSRYGQDGYKRIVIHNGNNEYVLISDFSNKTSPHYFEENGVSLNEGGTSDVQIELVERYLGITQDIATLVSCNYKFAAMSPGVRKALLLNHNPFEIGFMLDAHKKVSSAIRAYQNNLTRLYERKTALESEFINDSLEQELSKECEQLSKELSSIIEFGHRLTELIREQEKTSSSHVDVRDIHQKAKSIVVNSGLYKDVPRDNLSEQIDQLKHGITEDQINLANLKDQIQSSLADINKYSQYLANNNHKALSKELKASIDKLDVEIQKLKRVLINSPFDRVLLEDIPLHLEKMINILNAFIGCGDNLVHPEKIYSLKERLGKYQRLLYNYETLHHVCSDKLRSLEKNMSKLYPDPACVSTICPLLLAWKNSTDSIRAEHYTEIEKQRKFQHKIVRYSAIILAIQERITRFDQYTLPMNSLINYLNQNSHLRVPLKELNFLSTLRTQPFAVTTRIKEYYERSLEFYRYKDLSEERELLLAKYTKISADDKVDKEFIRKIVDEKTEKLTELRTKLTSYETKQQNDKATLRLHESYQATLGELQTYRQQLNDHTRSVVAKNDLLIYRTIKDLLEQQKIEVSLRLSEIKAILRNQETLRVRYTEEVINQITALEVCKRDLSDIEEALSPNSGMPHEYTVKFLNALIQNMNYFISRVFSYTFEFIPIDPNEPLTYKFKIRVGDVEVPDISECSTAQQEIINIVFMLADIIQRKLQHHVVFFDEPGTGFDVFHQQQILHLLKGLIEEGIIPQMFLVSHNATLHNGFMAADFLVLSTSNIILPKTYNLNATIEY